MLLLMRIIVLIPRISILYPAPISGYSSRQRHWESIRHVMFYITIIKRSRLQLLLTRDMCHSRAKSVRLSGRE